MLAALTDLSMVSYIQHLNAVLAECAPEQHPGASRPRLAGERAREWLTLSVDPVATPALLDMCESGWYVSQYAHV
jgi:hypothetical protein